MSDFLFTSESVSEGHPDKVSDQISDAVLDAILAKDPRARVAAETLVKDNLVVLAGEITTTADVRYQDVVRQTIRRIGYTDPSIGFDADTCTILTVYGQQSPDIAQGVDEGKGIDLDQGAGDQGLMFGYACDETPALMPLPIYLAHRLVERQSEVRRDGRLAWLRPDAKSQVTVRYVNGKPDSIETVLISTQHAPGVKHEQLSEGVIEEIIKPILPKNLVKRDVNYLVNPTGAFEIGGPKGDCGLTGRKIIVDTYGGSAPHGGGAFSGKDPSKVDRSAAYAGRREEHRRGGAGQEVSRAGVLRDRRGQADLGHGDHRGHRQALRRQALGARTRTFRSASEGHRADARSAAPDLRENSGLRAFRTRGARVHLGGHRPRAGPQAGGLAGL